MSLLRRIERSLAGREARDAAGGEVAAGTGGRAEEAGRAGGEVAVGTGGRAEEAGRGRPAEPRGPAEVAEARQAVRAVVQVEESGRAAPRAGIGGERGRDEMAQRACPPEQESRAAAARWVDPRVSGVYVLWSHRPRPAVRGARAVEASAGLVRRDEVAARGAGGEDMSRRIGPAAEARPLAGGPAPAVAGGGAGRVEAVSRVREDRGFVREVTRWPLVGARPPLLAGRALALPGVEAWRGARRWLIAHGREDMLEGALFLDVEATGLGHAAGTVAFVVGLARVAGECVEVEQWTLSRLSAEAAMLAEIAGRIAGGPLVTFNGASFDLPLLRGRLRRCGLDPSALAGVHLDLLPIARRLWRGRAPDCRLSTLERVELGAHRVGDIPGHAIPAVFWAALQRPDCPQAQAALRKVCAHNVVDILAMPALARAMAATLASPRDLDLALRTAEHLTASGRRPDALAAIEPWIDPLLAGPVAVDEVAALREGRALRLAAALLRREGLRERAAIVREAARRRACAANGAAGRWS